MQDATKIGQEALKPTPVPQKHMGLFVNDNQLLPNMSFYDQSWTLVEIRQSGCYPEVEFIEFSACKIGVGVH